MNGLVTPLSAAAVYRDARYGTVIELLAAGGALHRIGFALAEIDPRGKSPAHYHRRTEEIYYITKGLGRVRLGVEEREVGPGDLIAIPINLVHSIENVADEPLKFVCVTSPPYDADDDVEVAEGVYVAPPEDSGSDAGTPS